MAHAVRAGAVALCVCVLMSRVAGEELAGDSDKYPKPGNLEQGIYALAGKELKKAQHGEDLMAELLAAYRDAQRMKHAEYSNAHIELETLAAKSANAASDASILYQKDRRLRLEIMNLLTQQSIAKSSVVNTEIAVAGDLAEIGDLASSHGDTLFSETQKAALVKAGISAPVVKDTEKAVLALTKSEKGVAAAGSKRPLPKTEDVVLNHLDGKTVPKTEDVVLNHLDGKTANGKPKAAAVKQPKEAKKEAAKEAKKEAAKEVEAEAPSSGGALDIFSRFSGDSSEGRFESQVQLLADGTPEELKPAYGAKASAAVGALSTAQHGRIHSEATVKHKEVDSKKTKSAMSSVELDGKAMQLKMNQQIANAAKAAQVQMVKAKAEAAAQAEIDTQASKEQVSKSRTANEKLSKDAEIVEKKAVDMKVTDEKQQKADKAEKAEKKTTRRAQEKGVKQEADAMTKHAEKVEKHNVATEQLKKSKKEGQTEAKKAEKQLEKKSASDDAKKKSALLKDDTNSLIKYVASEQKAKADLAAAQNKLHGLKVGAAAAAKTIEANKAEEQTLHAEMGAYIAKIKNAKNAAAGLDHQMKVVKRAMVLVGQAQEAGEANAQHMARCMQNIQAAQDAVPAAESKMTEAQKAYEKVLLSYDLSPEAVVADGSKDSKEYHAMVKKMGDLVDKSQENLLNVKLQHRELDQVVKDANLEMVKLEQKVKESPGDDEVFEELRASVEHQKALKKTEAETHRKYVTIVDRLRKARDNLKQTELQLGLVNAVKHGRLRKAEAKLVLYAHTRAANAAAAAASSHRMLNAYRHTKIGIENAIKNTDEAMSAAVQHLMGAMKKSNLDQAAKAKAVLDSVGTAKKVRELNEKHTARRDALVKGIQDNVDRRRLEKMKEVWAKGNATQVEVQERTQKKWNATNYQQHGDSVKVTANIASMTSAEFDGVVSDYKAAVSSGKLILQVPTGQGGPHVYATVDKPVKKENTLTAKLP